MLLALLVQIVLLRSIDLSTCTAEKNILAVFLAQKLCLSGSETLYSFTSAENRGRFPTLKTLNSF